MSRYIRSFQPGGTFFFTVNTLERNKPTLTDNITALRCAVRQVRAAYPFNIDAWVVLPDHIHAIWTLPEGDNSYSNRWREIKKQFSKSLPKSENISHSRNSGRERGIWQRRFWEHTIRDEIDFKHHFDYVHINPLKHGLVNSVIDWPYSTFHKEVERGTYNKHWCGNPNTKAESQNNYGEP